MNERYQEHIDRLAREMGCQVRQAPGLDGMMFVEFGYVTGPTIIDQKDYLALLHELGHFALGHTQGRPPLGTLREYFENGVLRSEAQAWEWALNETIDIPTYSSRIFMWDFCLASYYEASILHGYDKPDRLRNGNRHYVQFHWDRADDFFTSVVEQIQAGAQGFRTPYPMHAPAVQEAG
jgi:hypothetical protein